MLKCGDTFLAPTTSHGTEHLWIIITDPDPQGKAVAVNITSRHASSETTVTVDVGDHPFLKHPSVVNFKDACVIDVNAVEAAIQKKPRHFICKDHKPCSPELLKRVQEGMLQSKNPDKDVKQRCAKEWEQKKAAAKNPA